MTDVASPTVGLGGLAAALANLAGSGPDPESRRAAASVALGELSAACGAAGARLELLGRGRLHLSVATGSLSAAGVRPAAGPTGVRPTAGPEASPTAGPLAGPETMPSAPDGVAEYPILAVPRARPRTAAEGGEGAVGVGEAPARLATLWLDRPRRAAGEAVAVVAMAIQVLAATDAVVYADRRFAALDDAIRAMTSVLAADRVLEAIVDRARELVDSQFAALGISDVDGVIEQFITSGMTRSERARVGLPPHGRGILGLILRENRTIRIDDITTDPRRAGFPPNHPTMHAFLGVPVRVRERTIGNLYLAEKDGGFTDDDERVVEALARHAGIAMENARLHEQVQRLAVVEERERIGRDLHDGIIQSIYAVGLSLEDVPDMLADEPQEAKRRVERAIDSLDQTIRDIRNFIFGLRPQLLEGVRLVEGLDALADEFRVNTMVDIEFRLGPDARDVPISPTRTLELLAVAREGLSNVARHAQATQATITLLPETDGPGLVLTLDDNGVGFDPGAARSGSHQGIRNIRGRAAAIDAALEIESRAGAGTRIIVRVPPDRAEEAHGDGSQAEPPPGNQGSGGGVAGTSPQAPASRNKEEPAAHD